MAATSPFAGWKDLRKFVVTYWRTYGGWRSLAGSPYVHIAAVITAFSWRLWFEPGWWSTPLSVLPNILGFTVGGFAIVLALGAGDFGAALSSASKPDADILDSNLAKLSAAFCHFILVQCLTLLLAMLAMALAKTPAPSALSWLASAAVQRSFWALGWFLGVYSLLLAISTADWIFTSVRLLIRYQKLQKKLKDAQKSGL